MVWFKKVLKNYISDLDVFLQNLYKQGQSKSQVAEREKFQDIFRAKTKKKPIWDKF